MKHLNIFQLISGIRRTILCVALCLFAGAYGATEYFVDINRTNDTGDGKSEATAFKTIQAALNAAVSGDTITVLPGEYKESPVEVEDLEEQGKSSKTRLYITKRITLRSKEGASKTHIVGAYDPDSDLGGMGPNAVRCITVRNGIGAVIKGFTIRDGAANATLNDKGDKGRTRSGGVSSRAHINSPDYQAVASSFTLVDCVISNCVGTRGGGIYGGNAVRCLLADNMASNYGCAARQSALFNCVLTRNKLVSGQGSMETGIVAYPLAVVNCTFVGNEDTYLIVQMSSSYGPVYNSLFVNNSASICGKVSKEAKRFYNCVMPDSLAEECEGCLVGNAFEMMAPIFDDYRLVAGAKSLNAGKAEYLSIFPEEYRTTDFEGKARMTGDSLNVGAVQSFSTPLSTLWLNNSRCDYASLVINGRILPKEFSQYVSTDILPAVIRIGYTPRQENYVISRYWVSGKIVWPYKDDGIDVFYPGSGVHEVFGVARPGRYVNPNPQIGSDVTGDGSKDKPYLTLQHAVDSHSDGNAVILAAEGTYKEGGKVGQGVNNRLYISGSTMRIKAMGDRDKTIIEGFSDPQSPDNTGCGSAAYRCVCLDGAHCLQGFTLKGGRTAYSETYSDGEPYRGGGFWGNRTHPATLADCVITDCVAGRGAAAFGGNLLRCIVTNNAVAGKGNSIVRNLSANACLFVDNDAKQNHVIGQDTILNQCTVADNRHDTTGTWRYTFNNSGSEAFNSVIGTTLNSIGLISGTIGSIANSLLEIPALQESWSDCVAEDPLIASSSDAPWKLYGCSSGVGLASASTLATPLDIEGNYYEINSSGKTVVGCYSTTKPGVRGVSEFDGGVSPSEVIPVDGVKEVKFTATADRPLLYFDVNGQKVDFDVAENGERSATITFDPVDDSGWIVTPVYGTTWFVDAKNGTDALGYGYTADKPLKSLAYSIKKTIENDTLVAAPGIYDIGYSKHGEDGVVTPWTAKNSLKSRVFIPSGRKLVSSEGASVTFIKGAPDTLSDTRDEYGRGPDAIRGVAMAANTLLKGFTIMEGRAGVVNEEVIENDGGGVYGYDTSSIVEDCIISNNAAYRGGGIRKGSAYRCRIVCNRSISMGSGARDTHLYNCLIDGNVGGTSVYSTKVVSSTFGPNIPKEQNQCYSKLEGAYLANNLFCTGRVDAVCISNCFFQSWSDCKESMRYLITSEREPEAYGLTWGDGSLPIDGNYRPLKGSKAIDSGSLTAADVVLTGTDLNGTQRVYNNAVDCGAFEYDWRRDYSRVLSASSGFAVTAAASSCVAQESSLKLINGTIDAVWSECPPSRFTVRLSVTGNGVLRVFCDNEEIKSVSSSDEEVELSYKAQGHNLKFVYEQAQGDDDSVGALISSVKRHGGTMIMIM